MSKRRKYSANEKISIIKRYLSGEASLHDIALELGYTNKKGNPGCFNRWVALYREHGENAFYCTPGNNTYTKAFKMQVVEEFISGSNSASNLAAKYRLGNADVLLRWAKLYNANRELKDYCPKREVYMANVRRKTTIEERKEIVEHCINHEHKYKDTAALYDVSYSQVYSWVKKYESNGEVSLADKRGHHKMDEEVDELERLRRENLRLKRQLEEKDMLAELLKKVKEFERM